MVFGLGADSRTYPDFVGGGRGALDRAIVGPAGLLDVLETQLGLLGPSTAKTVRIAVFMTKLGAAGPGRFWSKSFEKDPWATANLLLGWRDTLVSGGWGGAAIGPPRADDLAAAEAAGPSLPPGLADRLSRLTGAIGRRPGLRLARLTLLEPRPSADAGRRAIGQGVGAGGCVVEEAAFPAATGASDLARAQRVLEGGPAESLVGDGTLVLLEADTTLMAAEAVADWLAAAADQDGDGTVVLAPDGDTVLLDHALSGRGLPALGLSRPARSRAILHVLPLAFAVAWAPFDPAALRDLLLLSQPPVPRFVARRLARALHEAPGLGGPAWRRAWADIEATARERNPDGVAARLAAWRAWTLGGQHSRREGMLLGDVIAIAKRIEDWALARDVGRGDALLLSLAGAAHTVADAAGRAWYGATLRLIGRASAGPSRRRRRAQHRAPCRSRIGARRALPRRDLRFSSHPDLVELCGTRRTASAVALERG